MNRNSIHTSTIVNDISPYYVEESEQSLSDRSFAERSPSGTLLLEDGSRFAGFSFGYEQATAGEVVFSTNMVGYPEAITDPSFTGEILVMTYPLIGNYGVPGPALWESNSIRVKGLVVSNYIDTPSHYSSIMTLKQWLHQEKIAALEIKDTRLLTQHIRQHGSMLGKIIFEDTIPFYDPNQENLVAQVSTSSVQVEGHGDYTIALIDCGAKRNIVRSLLDRHVRVVTVPWDWDLFSPTNHFDFDAILISNGPGNPQMVQQTIQTIRKALERKIPLFGICLGHQLLALAAGGTTYKLKFGHRSQNQPCVLNGTPRCYITTQNHGFAVDQLPQGFTPWFTNANDGSNEGMKHHELPFFSVQFHPEAAPGPMDTEWIFDYFLERIRC
ncbi:glutamine-hydrolyzing carbamoyl-phosphate synthase small subunit [Tengunoibacter tsumagoiensis]|uniref:Carbamoyl phosphate synthase small chain n=1 Tax=Tengunoibacter tsumagoiensis TaxID=2014871 RepID=A0A402A9I2_9CHLR|nr:glutamine-hydrolyzing carbamoyl-phosphate synthase small subunit [Tengunoibacter tsumagoiensis]GCE15615.1 carbamoyl-phosphate synthase small chain [Tengunoibacter tsumagoiensis]